MCGIGGIVQFNQQPVDTQALAALNRALGHRGPDGEGMHCKGRVGLCHRRLAIIDPNAGQQPFFSDDRRIALTYNGEVYNYRELRNELKHDFSFTTQSDTEVVLKAFQKWGIDCIQRFRGMFALGLYDESSGMLHLVRDRVGIKPLYYYADGERLAFASELGALLQLRWIPRNIDQAALADYFRYSYVPAPATIYQGVRKLEPGCLLTIDTRSGEIRNLRYWELPIRIEERDEGQLVEELDAILDETIRIYVRSDVPFGCFLSGGVDSSIVAALMSRHLDAPVETFSIGFHETAHSELPYAKEASNILHTHHHEKLVTPQLATDTLQMLACHFGEPFADSSAIPTYYVSREAATRVKMVLSGDGGDELFAGYNSYPLTWQDAADPLHPAKALFFRMLSWFAPSQRVRNGARFRSLAPQEKHHAQRRLFDQKALRALLPDAGIQGHDAAFFAGQDATVDLVTRFQSQDFKTYLPDDVLTKVDRMSMANSLEVRVPLLDHRLVEFAFSLPLSAKIRRRQSGSRIETKYLLKRSSAARTFPEQFLNRPKQGFGIPIAEWSSGDLLPLIQDRLLNPANPMFEWISRHATSRIVSSFSAGNFAEAAKLWSLLMFDAWLSCVHRR